MTGAINRPEVDVESLDYDTSETYDDPIEGEVTRHYYDCPNCGFPLCPWTACPDCKWYDDDTWKRTLDDDDEVGA